MNTVGIIAEYNPFHTGHAYHIRKAKEASGADHVVVVMSPDFVQRGEPALFDKYTRARMALLCGADLVLELPVCYATGSAEYFAEGAVTLLSRLGVIDALCFGAEHADPQLFARVASVLAEEPPAYTGKLREQLRLGMTFPQARSEALVSCLARSANESADICQFLGTPNNILGIEYCKALQRLRSSIQPLPVLRQSSRFDSADLDGPGCSALALRRGIAEDRPDELLLRYIPENCRALFLHGKKYAVTSEELLPFLLQKLLACDSYDSVFDLSPELSDRIRSLRYACVGKTYAQIVASLKTRQLTEARVRRALLHLILDIKANDIHAFQADGTIYYAKVLGMRRDAAPLLHELKNSCTVPFLTKPSHAHRALKGNAARMWQQDLFASHLYRSIQSVSAHTEFRSEYEITPLIL